MELLKDLAGHGFFRLLRSR